MLIYKDKIFMMLSQDSESRSKTRVEQTHKARTPKPKKCGACSCSSGFSAANPQFSKYILVCLVTGGRNFFYM